MSRPKRAQLLLTFETTTDALSLEQQACGILRGRLIPLPGDVAAGCGLCWAEPAENESSFLEFLNTYSPPYDRLVHRFG